MDEGARAGKTVRLRRRPRDGEVYPDRVPASERPKPAVQEEDDWGAIARIYDLEHPAVRGAELRFWDELAKESGGPVLELAAGSGRITLALAKKGHTVTGLELSEGMLARARGRSSKLGQAAQERIRWVQGDMSAFSFPGETFGLIFVAFNSFWLLPDEETQQACLLRMKEHLAPGGRVVLDLFPPVEDDFQDEEGITQHVAVEMKGRAVVRVKDYHWDPQIRRGVSDVRYYGGRPGGKVKVVASFKYGLRIVPLEEVRTLLRGCGFEVVEEYGSYEREPIEDRSSRAIFVCKADVSAGG
jgi:SAM-dependent methyltransferase